MARYKAPYRLIKPPKKGGIYYYRLGNDPNRTRHSTGCRTEKDARDFCEKLMSTAAMTNKVVLFEDYAKGFFIEGECSFMQSKKDEDKPIDSKLASDYRGYVKNYLIPYFGKYPLASINAVEIRKWRTMVKEGKILPPSLKAPPANATLNHVRRIFGIILNQAEEENLIRLNPIPKVKPLSKDVYKRRDILTKEEIDELFPKEEKSLLKIWKSYEKASMLFLVLTSGMRSGELRALKWSDLNTEKFGVRIVRAVKCNHTIGSPKGKKSRGSVVPIRIFELLEKWKEVSGVDNLDSFVYPGRDGISPSSASRLRSALKQAMKKTGINSDGARNLVVHSLRHTYNTRMRSIFSEDAIRRTIGHESEEMTDRYDHLGPNEAIELYDAQYRSAIEKTW